MYNSTYIPCFSTPGTQLTLVLYCFDLKGPSFWSVETPKIEDKQVPHIYITITSVESHESNILEANSRDRKRLARKNQHRICRSEERLFPTELTSQSTCPTPLSLRIILDYQFSSNKMERICDNILKEYPQYYISIDIICSDSWRLSNLPSLLVGQLKFGLFEQRATGVQMLHGPLTKPQIRPKLPKKTWR